MVLGGFCLCRIYLPRPFLPTDVSTYSQSVVGGPFLFLSTKKLCTCDWHRQSTKFFLVSSVPADCERSLTNVSKNSETMPWLGSILDKNKQTSKFVCLYLKSSLSFFCFVYFGSHFIRRGRYQKAKDKKKQKLNVCLRLARLVSVIASRFCCCCWLLR